MRARNIKPALFKNELLGQANPQFTILFEGLWCEADREGRMEDRPVRLRAEILPYRADFDIDAGLEWLKQNAFIDRYEVDGVKIIQVIKFLEHQRPHANETESVLPPKDGSTSHQGSKPAQPRTTKGDKRFALIPDPLLSDSGSPNPDTTGPSQAALAVSGLNVEVFKKWVDYRKKRKPAIKAISMEAAARELAAFGESQAAVVDHSIANGYQGLIAPKTQTSGSNPVKRDDTAEWAELKAHAANIGYRPPREGESIVVYRSDLRHFQNTPPTLSVTALANRLKGVA